MTGSVWTIGMVGSGRIDHKRLGTGLNQQTNLISYINRLFGEIVDDSV
jgi:hypothetical protein